MIRKIIIFIILTIAFVLNAKAFNTGTVLISNFNAYTPIGTYTHCNGNKCYFIKYSGSATNPFMITNQNGGTIKGLVKVISNITNYGPYIFFNMGEYVSGTNYVYKTYVINTDDDSTYISLGGYSTAFGNNGYNITKVGNKIIFTRLAWNTTNIYDYFIFDLDTKNFTNGFALNETNYFNATGQNIPTFWNYNNLQNYIIGDDIYYFRSNEFYKSTLGSNTENKILNGLSQNVRIYNFYKSNNGLFYLSFSLNNPGSTLNYFNSYSYNGSDFTSLGNKYILFEKQNTNTYISVDNIDYINYMYTGSTAPVFAPIYNSLNNNYNLNYIGKDNSLYSTIGFSAGTDGGSGGGGGTSQSTIGTGTSTTTTNKNEQICNLKTFTGVLSGTGTNEIVYNNLSTGSTLGTLYTNGDPLFQTYLNDKDLLNLLNDNQIGFTGSTFDYGNLIQTTIAYRANTITGYPANFDIYIGNPINQNYGPTILNVYLRGDNGLTYKVPETVTIYGNKYNYKISDTIKITGAVIDIKSSENGKMPTLQKFKFYGQNTAETKYRYECTYEEKFCGWDTYYNSQKKSFCIENGDFNYIKDEYIGDSTTTENSIDYSPITSKFDDLINAITGNGGSGSIGGNTISGSGFNGGGITFGSGAGSYNQIVGVGTGVNCETMFINGVFQYGYGTKINFMSFSTWDLRGKLGFTRPETTIFGVNLFGWIYDIGNKIASSITNLGLYTWNLLFNNFDFIYYLFNEPARNQNYCYFGIKLKVYSVWETNSFGTTNKRQFDYFITIMIMLALFYIIIKK